MQYVIMYEWMPKYAISLARWIRTKRASCLDGCNVSHGGPCVTLSRKDSVFIYTSNATKHIHRVIAFTNAELLHLPKQLTKYSSFHVTTPKNASIHPQHTMQPCKSNQTNSCPTGRYMSHLDDAIVHL